MTFIEIARPNLVERALILLVQGAFYNAFFLLYLVSPRTAHRVVGYYEEEAVVSYTHLPSPANNGDWQRVPRFATWSSRCGPIRPATGM